MFREVGSVISFLTLVPAGGGSLETVARYMHVFPLVGIALGVALGAFGLGLSEVGLEPLIVALLVVAATAILTGIHHTDGLGDFADGLMVKGSRERKLSAMRDSSTGSAGVVAIVLYIIGMIVSLSLMDGVDLLVAILLAEVAAKFAMVLIASIGTSAASGSNTPFLLAMRDRRRLVLAGGITVLPFVLLGGMHGAIALGAVVALTAFLAWLSSRSFGGVTGDVMGATNEITRLAAILVFASV